MWQNSSVVEKNYKKLSIQVSLNGLSFATFNTLTNEVIKLEKVVLGKVNLTTKIEDLFAEAFQNYAELRSNYDEIIVIHANNLSTFVPVALFDKEYLGSYLQFNTKVFETDFFTYDELDNYEMNNVYIPYVNLNNYFIDQFGSFDYKHANTILVKKVLDISKNIEEIQCFVHVADTHFEIVITQNQKLLLYNSFEYKTAEDFIYYILFTAEQLHLNPEHFKLQLLGKIEETDTLYTLAYKYIRNTNLLEIDFISGTLTEAEKREHFILLNS